MRVKTKTPVFYNGKRYDENKTLNIKEEYFNADVFQEIKEAPAKKTEDETPAKNEEAE